MNFVAYISLTLTFVSVIISNFFALEVSQEAFVQFTRWEDIDFVNRLRIISGLVFMVFVAVIAIIIFRSVWVKNGYAGIDKILVDKEVALFMSHVLAFALLEVFIFLIIFYEYAKVPDYVFWICAGGFLSPEIMQATHALVNFFTSRNKTENKSS